MDKTLQNSHRLNVVDALRGFALLAIVLLHNLEHYNIYFIPEAQPEWLQTLDKGYGIRCSSYLREKLMQHSHSFSDLVSTFNTTMPKSGE